MISGKTRCVIASWQSNYYSLLRPVCSCSSATRESQYALPPFKLRALFSPTFNNKSKLILRRNCLSTCVPLSHNQNIQNVGHNNASLTSISRIMSPKMMTCKSSMFTTASTENNEAASQLSIPTVTKKLESSDASISGVNPLEVRDYFGVHKLFTVKDLFNARVHLGHSVRIMATQMIPFIYGTRFDICIFDLDETAMLLRQALNFISHIAYRGGIILFVARQPQMVHLVERTAIECGEYAHCRPWTTETFTAPRKTFDGEVRLPDLVILLHTKVGTQGLEHQAIIDSAKIGIPTVGIVDSDCNPNIITYPIPGNDDTLDSTQLYLHLFKQAILHGKKKRDENTND